MANDRNQNSSSNVANSTFGNVYDEVQKYVPGPFLAAFVAIDAIFSMLNSVDHYIVYAALLAIVVTYIFFCAKFIADIKPLLIVAYSTMLVLWCINMSEFRAIQLLDYWFELSTEGSTRVLRILTAILVLILLALSLPDILKKQNGTNQNEPDTSEEGGSR